MNLRGKVILVTGASEELAELLPLNLHQRELQ